VYYGIKIKISSFITFVIEMKQLDKLTVNVLVDNTADMLSTRPAHISSELSVLMDAGMNEIAGQSLCLAQHGLSLVVTAHLGQLL
jgi:7,8-dihydropterin-6-yl-methyl-4-(beta-D-ribofuranosyl)aminobenzene 5'-phosphate synthase